MKKLWDTIIDGMDKVWERMIGLLAKVNSYIPLSAVLLAGFGLIGVVLVLAICGCVLRKRLVPHWLIWTYFTFATIIIFAHTGNNLAAVVEAMEIPVLVILVCYLLNLIFRRRPRYTYVEKEVYARQLAKGQVYQLNAYGAVIVPEPKAKKVEKEKVKPAKKNDREVVDEMQADKIENVDEVIDSEAALREAEKAEREAENAKLAAAEQAAREAREAEKAAERKAAEKAAREAFSMPAKEEPVKRVDKTDFLTARTVRPNLTSSTATAGVDLPTVNPIPDKSYEPTREPTIVTKPISQTIPGLKMGSSTTPRFSTTPRPTSFGSTASRPTTPISSFSSLNSRPNTTTTSSFSRPTTSSTATVKPATNSSTARSTEDIMAAIERLRNSMKK